MNDSAKFGQAKDVLVKWFKSIPADFFYGCSELPCFEDENFEVDYKPRYLKSIFLDELNHARHISDIPILLETINSNWENVIIFFLTSKLSAQNAESTQIFIELIDDDNARENLSVNYSFMIKYGIKNLYNEETQGIKLFKKVEPADKLNHHECFDLVCETLGVYSYDEEQECIKNER